MDKFFYICYINKNTNLFDLIRNSGSKKKYRRIVNPLPTTRNGLFTYLIYYLVVPKSLSKFIEYRPKNKIGTEPFQAGRQCIPIFQTRT